MSHDAMKIFIPGAGGKAQHIKNFKEVPGVREVVISEIYPWAYGNWAADRAYELPRFDAPDFLERFERIYEKERFDVCLPLHDASLLLFSRNRDRWAGSSFRLAINPAETIELVADKMATYRFFVEHGIPTPETCNLAEFLDRKEFRYPYQVKPRRIEIRGTSRQYFAKLEDDADVEYVRSKLKGRESEFVVQEFVSGTEINIDLFCDEKGTVRSIVPLTRLAMGTSRGISRGEILADRRFDRYIGQIAGKVRLWGANQVQAFMTEDDRILFTEINGRFSGSSVFVKEAGVNFFAHFVRLLRGEPIEIREEPRPLRMTTWEQPWFYTESPLRRL